MKFHPSRRALLGAAALAISSAMLAGCAPAATPSAGSSVAGDPSQVSGEINFGTWWSYADQAMVDGFKAKYPNVKVNLQFTAIDGYPTKIQALASGGNLPDVFAAQGPTLAALAKADQLLNLNDGLATQPHDGDAATWKASFEESLLTGANADMAAQNKEGETFGVPFSAISVASIYNKDIFEKVGVTPPTTFDQLLGNCKSLKAAGYIPMSLTGAVWGNWWTRLAWDQTMRGSSIDDFSVSDPNYIKGLTIVKQMADAGCWDKSQISTDIAGETSLFLQKKTAQFISVPENFLQSVVKGADFNIGTYVLPGLDGKDPVRVLGGGNANVLVVSKSSKNPAAAIAFAKYLTSTEVQVKTAKTMYTIPVLNIELTSDNELMASFLTAASAGFVDLTGVMPTLTPAGETKFNNEVLPKLILGQITPEQAAAASADFFQK